MTDQQGPRGDIDPLLADCAGRWGVSERQLLRVVDLESEYASFGRRRGLLPLLRALVEEEVGFDEPAPG